MVKIPVKILFYEVLNKNHEGSFIIQKYSLMKDILLITQK